MNAPSSKTQTRVKVGFPSGVEFEFSRELQNESDNIICFGDQIGIRACDGEYWQVNRNNEDRVMALAKHIKEWEIIEIVAVGDEFVSQKKRPVRYNEEVAFRFIVNNSFVGADLNTINNELTARVPWVKDWQKFTLLEHPHKVSPKDKKARYGSWFALRACNNQHVMFDKNDSKQLFACVPHIDEWEAFVFIHPSAPR
jgi:hypothetical protein